MWPKLFSSHGEKNSRFPTKYVHFGDLVEVIRRNSGTELFKNGAVKNFLQLFMIMSTYDDHKIGERSCFFTRTSTTDPSRWLKKNSWEGVGKP